MPLVAPAGRQLAYRRSDTREQVAIDVRDLAEQALRRHAERPRDLLALQTRDERALERTRDLDRKTMESAALARGQVEAQACEGEHVVPHRAEHVLGLPQLVASQGRPHVQPV